MTQLVPLLKIVERDEWLCVSDDIEFAELSADGWNIAPVPFKRGECVFLAESKLPRYPGNINVILVDHSTVVIPKIGFVGEDRLTIQLNKVIAGDVVIRLGIGKADDKVFFVVGRAYRILSQSDYPPYDRPDPDAGPAI